MLRIVEDGHGKVHGRFTLPAAHGAMLKKALQAIAAPKHRTHAHHDHPWSHGGTTDLKTGRLLCPRHHTHAHDPAYHHTRLPGGKIRFHRRT